MPEITAQQYEAMRTELTGLSTQEGGLQAKRQALTEERERLETECKQQFQVGLAALPARRQELSTQMAGALQKYNVALGKVKQYAPGN